MKHVVVLIALALLTCVLSPTPTADAALSRREVAKKVARQLGCRPASVGFYAGETHVPGSKAQLACTSPGQRWIVYVFDTRAQRARGIRYWKRWSGPFATYYFAKAARVVITPQGSPGPYQDDAYTRPWARKAANRTGGAVFGG